VLTSVGKSWPCAPEAQKKKQRKKHHPHTTNKRTPREEKKKTKKKKKKKNHPKKTNTKTSKKKSGSGSIISAMGEALSRRLKKKKKKPGYKLTCWRLRGRHFGCAGDGAVPQSQVMTGEGKKFRRRRNTIPCCVIGHKQNHKTPRPLSCEREKSREHHNESQGARAILTRRQ